MARFVTKKEEEGRKLRLRVFAGMFDFLATVGSILLIFACVALLASLVTWIRNDAQTTFAVHRIFHLLGADYAGGDASAPAVAPGAFSFFGQRREVCARFLEFPAGGCGRM